ncbi:DUF6651 domain-containing protein [Azotobacter chroococcum]|uniref:DUF6651 domain-containing protein n=1 Tax=Azotobacter chroococcum TaxID=353 RepID=A0A4R1PJ77_9GAMM|nr:DUF6651 domain-containing protein [Azotobacter chroococcum]TBV95958.1 hypothetical protein E0E53_12175 [Azotobacter chroococcum]TCL26824.1 hypothetical protein EV691_12929 [Azotobacter chroococcum]
MKLKLDEQGHAVLQDGKPVYVHDDGKEVAFDAPATVATITRLNSEARTHREGKEAAEKALKAFEGIEDGAAAKKALEIVANLDQKKLVDAGEIEKVKAEIGKAYQAQLEEVSTKAQAFEKQLYDEKIGGAFARSKLIAEKLAIPADLVQARFGQAFKIEDGKTVAYDAQGNKVFSRARPGELADFDEALETLVEQYPYRDHILKASGANGGGAPAGNGGNPGKKTLNRAAFDQLDPAGKAAHVRSGGAVID